ncbi:MAG TPA: crosslink repair DNA glycosylase YcaQ family protein [Thermoanaerobaculia bacterium]|nr:crosslink repair DNA glycosylase YcaQ family protein [Thermoanaerobaculia bacterium]
MARTPSPPASTSSLPRLRRLPRVSAAAGRRLLLGAQGLLDGPGRATSENVYELVRRLGYVQIDSINVVERAHHLILAPRLSGYRTSLLTGLLERQRRLFEHWTHDAAAIPTAWFPYWHHRFDRYRRELPRRSWWRGRMGGDPEAVIARVRARLQRDGPLLARELGGERGRGTASSWLGWSPEKTALEFLWWTGEAAIAGRRGFHKLYDLTERVLPEAVAAPRPGPREHLDWACRTAIERLGVATPAEIAAFWQAVPAAAIRTWCQEAAARDEIAAVELEAADGSPPRPAFAVAGWQDRSLAEPASRSRIRLLCPFDPILHDRRRALRLFRFDFRFEAFVPAAERQHGYYVMPLLEGERLVGRIDPKLHRAADRLDVRSVRWEPGVRPSRRRWAALDAAVGRLAALAGAGRWELPAAGRPRP